MSIKKLTPYLWLGLGTLALFFTGGKFNVVPFAWVGSVFFIRFARSQKAAPGYLLVGLASGLVSMVTWHGIQPMTGAAYAISMLVTAFISALPLLADRLLYRKMPGWLATLVFPVFSTAFEYIFVSSNPMGSFGAIAYSQFRFAPFLQFASIGGLTGMAFLILWLPSLVNYLWEHSWKTSRSLIVSAATIYSAVLVFGLSRLALADKEPETVSVSMIVRGDGDASIRTVLPEFISKSKPADRLLDGLIEATISEAENGSAIIAWPEGSIVARDTEMPAIRTQLSQLSEDLGVYLVAPYMVLNDNSFENGLDLYSPIGLIELNHIKFGGNVFEGSIPGDGILGYADTEYGRIAAAVCWDMDFPKAINKAGRDSVDILISPSSEWREIVPIHAQMAVFRGVENGLNTIHPSSMGLSIAADPYGQILDELNWFEHTDSVLRVEIPRSGTTTPYARFGEIFGPLSSVMALLLTIYGCIKAVLSVRHRKK